MDAADSKFWMDIRRASARAGAEERASMWEKQATKLEREIVVLADRLKAEQMHAAGLSAVLEAVRAKPGEDLFTAQETDEDGNTRTVAGRIYEENFIRKGQELGLIQPEQYLKNNPFA